MQRNSYITEVYVIKTAGKESMLMAWVNRTSSEAGSSWLEIRAITSALSKAITGISGNNDAKCYIRIAANGYGGISAFDASQQDNDQLFCESVIERLSKVQLPSPSKKMNSSFLTKYL